MKEDNSNDNSGCCIFCLLVFLFVRGCGMASEINSLERDVDNLEYKVRNLER